MENSEVTNDKQNKPSKEELTLTVPEKKQIADFFSVLIQIDKRTNITKTYGNEPNK